MLLVIASNFFYLVASLRTEQWKIGATTNSRQIDKQADKHAIFVAVMCGLADSRLSMQHLFRRRQTMAIMANNRKTKFGSDDTFDLWTILSYTDNNIDLDGLLSYN